MNYFPPNATKEERRGLVLVHWYIVVAIAAIVGYAHVTGQI